MRLALSTWILNDISALSSVHFEVGFFYTKRNKMVRFRIHQWLWVCLIITYSILHFEIEWKYYMQIMHSTRICMYESTRFYFKLVTINLTFLGTHALTSCCLWQSCCCGTIPVLKTSLRVFFLRLNLRSNCSNRLNACPLLTTRPPPWTTSYFSVWCCRLFSSLRMSIADTLARLDETSSSSLSSSSSSAERRYLPTSHEYMLCEV